MDRLSVIIPAFGQINPNSLYLSILGSKNQSFPTEVIVIEEYLSENRYSFIAEQLSVKYVSYKIQDSFNIARARNHGISESTGKYLLMHDADIVFSDSLFVEKAIRKLHSKNNEFLVSPKLQHIQKCEIDLWKEDAENHNNDPFHFLNGCSTYDDFIITTLPIDENDFVVTPHPYNESKRDRLYVAIKELFEKYKCDPTSFKGSEPLIFTPCLAKGFVLCLREQADAVGLYSEGFSQWGGEDGDFKWKLSHLFESTMLSDLSEIHLDHDRPYFTPEVYEKNKIFSKARRQDGFKAVLQNDKLKAEVYL
jgi:glycosyltransferase involved in cell wall biosynthesis